MNDPYTNTIAHLRAELARRTEENETLRYQLERMAYGDTSDLTLQWLGVFQDLKLTKAEGDIVRLLYNRPVLTKEAIYEAMYALRPNSDSPDQKIIDVWICKIRAKLPAKDYVETVWGRGYKLSDECRAWLKLRIEKEIARVAA